MKTTFPPKKQGGFTLVEICFTIVILATVITIAIPAVNNALRDASDKKASANVQTLNQAATRARLAGKVGPGTYGSDKTAALNWYLSERLVSPSNKISLNGIFYTSGLWEKNTLPNDPAAVLALISPRLSTPEEDITRMLQDYGYSSPEDMAENWGYGTGDLQAMLDSYGVSTLDELGQNFGYADYNDWVNNWWGYDPGQNQVASWMGFNVPGSGNPTALALDQGYNSFQEMATAWYGGSISPTITDAQIREISARLGEFGPEVIGTLANNTTINTPENLVLLQNALANAIANGETSTWTNEQIQEPLFTFLTNSAGMNPNGELLSQMDFSALDLTNRSIQGLNLTGSNLTGTQINEATSINNSNLTGLNLAGLDVTGKNVSNTNFTGATGITAAEIITASSYQNANLSGIDFTGTSFTGKTLQGVTISNPQNFTGSMLNGSTNITGVKLLGVDLTGWTIPNVPNQTISSLAGSTLSQTQKNALFGNTGSAPFSIRQTNLQGVDLSGTTIRHDSFLINYTGVTGLTGASFQNSIFTEAWLPIDMTGYNWNGKTLRGTNLSGATGVTGANLNNLAAMAPGFWGVNLSNQNLTGWQPTYSIQSANLTNVSGITAASLASASDIRNIRLTGTGITKADLDAALIAAGKNPATGNFNTSTIIF